MRKTSHFLLVAVCALAFAGAAYAVTVHMWTTGQNASSVLGQTDFVTNTPGAGNNKLHDPLAVAIDPATGKVFVSDFNNNRVMRFTSAAALANGSAAEAVIGQPDFATITSGTTTSKLNQPYEIAIDSSGRLWVADAVNRRVLRFDNAATVASGTAVAAQVLGILGTNTITQNTFSFPSGVAVDSSGRLWVADQGAKRILRFDNAAARGNAPNADGVLGAANFTTGGGSAATQSTFNSFSIAVEGNSLWAADYSNSRVLRFNNAATKANGGNADGVLGQPDFTTGTAGTSSTTMRNPLGVAVDTAGRLYVSDANNNRVLVFYPAQKVVNGGAAANALGQPDMNTGTVGTTQSKMNFTWTVAPDPANPDQIYVPEELNHRVTRWVATGAPTAAGVTVSGRVVNSSGYAVRGATVSFVASDGTRYTAIANSFGYYSLANVPSGETYMANVASRGLVFVPRAVTVTDQLTGVDFAAQ